MESLSQINEAKLTDREMLDILWGAIAHPNFYLAVGTDSGILFAMKPAHMDTLFKSGSTTREQAIKEFVAWAVAERLKE